MTPDTSYREIPLTQGQVAIVDAADFEWLSQWKWCAHWAPSIQGFYAERATSRTLGKQYMVQMHRFILGLEKGDKRMGDHRNHHTLDNRRENLRIADRSQNARNRFINKDRVGLKGVYFNPKCTINPWSAQIKVAGKMIYIGYFATPEAAHDAYRIAAAEYFGEFAHGGQRGCFTSCLIPAELSTSV